MRGFVLGCVLAAASCGGGTATDEGGSADAGSSEGSSAGETGAPTEGGSTGVVDPCDGPTRCPIDGAWPFEKLSEYDFFQGPMVDLTPKDGVVPYMVGSALWSDHAGKGRFIVLPEGGKIEFSEADDWEFPDGTIIIKTFFFDHDRRDPEAGYDIIETRLLIRQDGVWDPHTYLWNEEQTEATIIKTGKRVDVSFVDVDGVAKEEEYIVPNLDQCASCHERDDVQRLLGLVTLQMNRVVDHGGMVNQIDWLADLGMFATAPPKGDALPGFVDPMGTAGTLDERARGYLHGNCAHCHRPGGGASKSGLVFLATEPELAKVGVCKVPAAAGPGTGGHAHDIEPGDPDRSIVIFRMNSLDPEIKMPELPNRVIDAQGVELIREWIAAMPAEPCGGP
jgi:uncharacterized repeat protein (TIGR03806 family)